MNTIMKEYVTPGLMFLASFPLAGFGVANWTGVFDMGRALFGFLTAVAGFIMAVLGVVYWWYKLRRQRRKSREEEETEL